MPSSLGTDTTLKPADESSRRSEPVPIPASPTDLRTQLRTWRRQVPEDRRAEAAAATARHALSWTALGEARLVGSYAAIDGELDPQPITTVLSARGARLFIPVIVEPLMRFGLVTDDIELVPNRHGIDEPIGVSMVEASALDAVIVPLIAVDASGNRVGFGGGYYDRAFAWLAEINRPGPTVLIGVCYDEQVVESIVPDAWDIALDAVATPTRLRIMSARTHR